MIVEKFFQYRDAEILLKEISGKKKKSIAFHQKQDHAMISTDGI